MDITIVIDEIFKGNLEEWQEQMFPFPSLDLGARIEHIISWCASMEMEVDIQCRLKRNKS